MPGKVEVSSLAFGFNSMDFAYLSRAQSKTKRAVKDAKKPYYSRFAGSLNDPNLASKKYWSILNQFLHKKKSPRIPPVRDASNNLVADTVEKTNIFNRFLLINVLLLKLLVYCHLKV